ncbi:lectin-like domain-containing protein [Vagococcus intermedius]|uniref:Uncharacterized protein n=1 Tax=Vagococcus intermedius TaxID=2991418 RepID=A0AAF0I7R9_9ENTE|nr:hypothetical protein [Vagococcus intermedius]WEG73590.1 hypothetical protein OL234_01405 [Vagococcus intermedius]WEG75674.1 hypothetical protein OL235_01415 [Vagococcus intermedius]
MSSLLCLNTATLSFVEADAKTEMSRYEKNNKTKEELEAEEETGSEVAELGTEEEAESEAEESGTEEEAESEAEESGTEEATESEVEESETEEEAESEAEESGTEEEAESEVEESETEEEAESEAEESETEEEAESEAEESETEEEAESEAEESETEEEAESEAAESGTEEEAESEAEESETEEEAESEVEESGTEEEAESEAAESETTEIKKEEKRVQEAPTQKKVDKKELQKRQESFNTRSETEVPPLPKGLYTLPLSEVFADPVGDGFPGVSEDGKILNISDAPNQSGAIWSKNEISLKKSFETEAYLYFGNQGTSAADGITFTLLSSKIDGSKGQKTLGLKGQGLGIYGNKVEGAATIEMDTFYNSGESDGGVSGSPSGDEAKDHIAFTQPTSVYMQGDWSDPKQYPVKHMETKFVGSSLSDGEWKKFSVKWERIAGKQVKGNLSYTLTWLDPETGKGYKEITDSSLLKIGLMEGSLAATPKTDVYWGFTGSTGGNGAKNAVAMSRLPESPEVAQTIEIKDKDGNLIEGDQPVPAGTDLEVSVTNKAESGDMSWKNIVTTIDYSDFGEALTFIEGPEGKEATVSDDKKSVSFSATDSVDIGDSETLTFKMKAVAGTESKRQLRANAIGENGLAECSDEFQIEKVAAEPITIQYVYDKTNDQELLPNMSSQTFTPEEGQTELKVTTNLTGKHFSYRGNSLKDQAVNEEDELVIPFTEKEQTVYIRYDGQTWLESVKGDLAFKGKLQPAKQVLAPQDSQIDLVVKSTAYQPNWQLIAKVSEFKGPTLLPSKGLVLLVNGKEIRQEATPILSEYLMSQEEHFVIGETQTKENNQLLKSELLVAPHSYRWAKKLLNYDTTITWTVSDTSLETPSDNSQALPLKGGETA